MHRVLVSRFFGVFNIITGPRCVLCWWMWDTGTKRYLVWKCGYKCDNTDFLLVFLWSHPAGKGLQIGSARALWEHHPFFIRLNISNIYIALQHAAPLFFSTRYTLSLETVVTLVKIITLSLGFPNFQARVPSFHQEGWTDAWSALSLARNKQAFQPKICNWHVSFGRFYFVIQQRLLCLIVGISSLLSSDGLTFTVENGWTLCLWQLAASGLIHPKLLTPVMLLLHVSHVRVSLHVASLGNPPNRILASIPPLQAGSSALRWNGHLGLLPL